MTRPHTTQQPTAADEGALAERIEAMDLGPDVVRMMRDRQACQVWLTLLQPGEAKDFDDVARIAGLEPLGRAWVEVDTARARQFLVAISSQGLGVQARSDD
jgi:hypothetical protein